jgi:hypothetical protein
VADGVESCDQGVNNGDPGFCCTAQCGFVTVGTTCRAFAGGCDIEETCSGSDGTCPTDSFQPSSYQCVTQNSPCTFNATCTGSSASCPDNTLADNSTCISNTSDLCTSDYCLSGDCITGDPISYDDGLFCNGNETCNPLTGGLIQGEPPCNISSGCVVLGCDEDLAMCCENCTSNITIPCPDPPNQCQEYICNMETTECDLIDLAGSCDDGLACTVGDTCVGGSECEGIPTTACDSGDPCITGTCNEPLGDCSYTITPSTCSIEGTCYNDGDPNPLFSCQICNHTVNTTGWTFVDVPDTPCNPTDLCIVDATCNLTSLSCEGFPMDCSFLNDTCITGVCDTGDCIPSFDPLGTPCDPMNLCVTNAVCDGAGGCTIYEFVDCDDDNNQTLDFCNSTIGCYHVNITLECFEDSDCTQVDCYTVSCEVNLCDYQITQGGCAKPIITRAIEIISGITNQNEFIDFLFELLADLQANCSLYPNQTFTVKDDRCCEIAARLWMTTGLLAIFLVIAATQNIWWGPLTRLPLFSVRSGTLEISPPKRKKKGF